jgi:hypothetical protein
MIAESEARVLENPALVTSKALKKSRAHHERTPGLS